jgi:nickel-dependent lactate racemase
VQIHLATADDLTLTLDVPADRLVADWSRPRSVRLEGGHATAKEAIRSPLGFPPLGQSVIPGDLIAVPVDPDTPELPRVVAELLEALLEVGSDPSGITVLVAGDRELASQERIRSLWPQSWRESIHLVAHHADDETSHAYVAATRQGRPLYVNRAIGEADVVIPVGPLQLDDAPGYRGVHGSWFPLFSNLETQLRHQSPGNLEWKTHQRRRQEETSEAAWLLGVQMTLQVLPGPHGSVAGVYFGAAEEVSRQGARACGELWSHEVDRPADLVIASLDSDSEAQSWRHIAQALGAALPVVTEGGAIVLWTEVSERPGPALRSLSRDDGGESQRLALLRQRSPDAVAAKVVGDCLRNCRVYLRSHIDDARLEDVGIAPIHHAVEIQRLIARSDSTIVVGSAQVAGLRVKQAVEAQ